MISHVSCKQTLIFNPVGCNKKKQKYFTAQKKKNKKQRKSLFDESMNP
jgi:hypothetical protein